MTTPQKRKTSTTTGTSTPSTSNPPSRSASATPQPRGPKIAKLKVVPNSTPAYTTSSSIPTQTQHGGPQIFPPDLEDVSPTNPSAISIPMNINMDTGITPSSLLPSLSLGTSLGSLESQGPVPPFSSPIAPQPVHRLGGGNKFEIAHKRSLAVPPPEGKNLGSELEEALRVEVRKVGSEEDLRNLEDGGVGRGVSLRASVLAGRRLVGGEGLGMGGLEGGEEELYSEEEEVDDEEEEDDEIEEGEEGVHPQSQTQNKNMRDISQDIQSTSDSDLDSNEEEEEEEEEDELENADADIREQFRRDLSHAQQIESSKQQPQYPLIDITTSSNMDHDFVENGNANAVNTNSNSVQGAGYRGVYGEWDGRDWDALGVERLETEEEGVDGYGFQRRESLVVEGLSVGSGAGGRNGAVRRKEDDVWW